MRVRKSLLLFFVALLMGCAQQESKNIKTGKSSLSHKPNIIVLLTDQERYPAHWPQGWVEKNLPSAMRLKQNGLTFHRAYTAASECSPSRAVIMTSEHYPLNGVEHTPPPAAGLPTAKQLMDIGALLKEKAGYEVVWKGKWHLDFALAGASDWAVGDIANLEKKYDLAGWNPPDAGNAIMEFQMRQGKEFYGLTTLGGGYADNDGRYVQGVTASNPKQTQGFGESVLDYLAKVQAEDPKSRKPFCLFISLVNPHDVWVYPPSWKDAGYDQNVFADVGIDLPDNFNDTLVTKPSIQAVARTMFNAQSPLEDKRSEKEYVNFYAYLHTVVDKHIGTILDALEAAGLTEDTLIIRMADHGELGLSHGMREKAYTMYEEMIHIPLIVSNPMMYPEAQNTDAFYCHLDLLPTLAELAGVPNFSSYGKGVSIVPVLKDPAASVQDSILFTYDDLFVVPAKTPGGHIRAIREGDWAYGVYYSEDGSHFEYEMYNLRNDPGELTNLLYGKVSAEVAAEARRLHIKLKEKMDKAGAVPKGFTWPASPISTLYSK